jgi:hypothetical protein
MFMLIPIAVGLTITLSAFLLFQVQPLFARIILPWFGGSPSVWLTALVFFQCLLLFGYVYADLLFRKVALKNQLIIHQLLTWCAVFSLNLTPDESWKDLAQIEPVRIIFTIMALHVALPYFLLSTTAPLLQGWLTLVQSKKPLKFYALSNAASLVALLSFPIFFEPLFGTRDQIRFWSSGFLLFSLSLFTSAILIYSYQKKNKSNFQLTAKETSPTVSKSEFALWTLLSMTGVMILLSVTSFLSYDIAAVPLLWVLPLAVYLLSFVFTFSSEKFYVRKLFIPAAIAFVLLFIQGSLITPQLPFATALTYTLIALFIWCMVCNGELIRLKPKEESLTVFYLALSLGGAIGGLSVGIVAPFIFNSFLEFPISLFLLTGILVYLALKDPVGLFGTNAPRRYRATLVLSFVGLILATSTKFSLGSKAAIDQSRNFYGVLQVRETNVDEPSKHRRTQTHGQIIHGSQFQLEAKKMLPTEYYGESGGVGIALKSLEQRPTRKIGIVGLGVGTIKAYGRTNDQFVLYEINPDVITQAKKYFTYLDSTPGTYRIVLGDGRLALEKEVDEKFDLLVLDAFSSDSIPVHLLTTEAFNLYLERLKPDGILAVHVSNRHLDVAEVVLSIAESLSVKALDVEDFGNEELGTCDSEWILISTDQQVLDSLIATGKTKERKSKLKRPWSDDYSNLITILQ